jgi:hypothetical protein
MTQPLQAAASKTRLLALGTLALFAAAAQAQTVVPATVVSLGVLDSNHFIVGHPASPRWKRAQANAEHPAVVQKARAITGAIDSNAFRVQPPASVRWMVQPTPLLLARVPGQG